MTIISFIAINFGAIYRTTKSSYRDSPNADTERQRGDELLNKCYFNFFAYKKYSRRIIKFRLNH